eukprot:g53220.t1
MYTDLPHSRSFYDAGPTQSKRRGRVAGRGMAAILVVLVVVVFSTAFAFQSQGVVVPAAVSARAVAPAPVSARAVAPAPVSARAVAPGAVSVQGKYLVYPNGTRFFMRGIAWPITAAYRETGYDKSGWKAVLEQLATLTDINTVRIYNMDCRGDYSEFITHAQALGIYLIVPFTAARGDGDLKRELEAPYCYKRRLFDYGAACIDQFAKYPNVLAGMIGNEVMNDVTHWNAAPCVAAYTRDLKRYMKAKNVRALPLMYATQHAAIGAVMMPEVNVRNTLDYLTCANGEGVDMFGINVESWCSSLQTFEKNEDDSHLPMCSSLQTFEKNEDGTVNPYYALWSTMHNVSTPLVFSEMGCSKDIYNGKNGLTRFVRDWKQIPVVLHQMADIFSGFCAYTYDGAPLFRMMDGTNTWDGHGTLPPGQDFLNFKSMLADTSVDSRLPENPPPSVAPPSCPDMRARLQPTGIELYPFDSMPSYFKREQIIHTAIKAAIVVSAVLVVAVGYCLCTRRSSGKRDDDGLVPESKYKGYQSLCQSSKQVVTRRVSCATAQMKR